ncbi:MAG: nucleoside deaminase [Firmicutes bacterium]|nr:nucleoside deaminase [Bacillota bacterium]
MLTKDEILIQHCIDLAITSGKKGYNTFGSILVHNGKILEEGENTEGYIKEAFGHAEFNLMHKCVGKYSLAFLSNCVVYTSTFPCVRCLMSIASLGIRKVVYSVSDENFALVKPFKSNIIDYPSALKTMGVEMEMIGPILQEEGMKVYSYRFGKYQPLEEILAESAELRNKED